MKLNHCFESTEILNWRQGVDCPLPRRLLKPKPVEVNVHGPRHPTLWTDVPKIVDLISHRPSHAIVVCDINFISEKSFRKVLNMVRPPMRSIIIDIAFIISKPKLSEIEEPSACSDFGGLIKLTLKDTLYSQKEQSREQHLSCHWSCQTWNLHEKSAD